MQVSAPVRDRLVQHPIRIGRRGEKRPRAPPPGPPESGISRSCTLRRPSSGAARRSVACSSPLRIRSAIVAPAMVYSARAMTAPPGAPQPYRVHLRGSPATRPVAMGRRGMVCSGHQLASLAGISVLQRGGDAVDAALAVAATLNVAEPAMSGAGGDGFLMLYRRAAPQVEVVNATGPAPALATRESYLPEGIPLRGIRSVSVPGLVDGWLEAHARYGRLSLATVLKPAMQLAEGGLPVSDVLAAGLAGVPQLGAFAPSQPIFWPQGRPPRAGEVLLQRDLARTFKGLAEHGRDYFYRGPVARAVDALSQEQGGAIRYEDFAGFHARWEEPIRTTYRGHAVYEFAPNSSGHVLLQELNLLEGFDLPALGWHDARTVHLMVEAKKLAFADRERYLADPDFVDIPLEGLLSKEYAAERRKLIDPQRAAPPDSVLAGRPRARRPDRRTPPASWSWTGRATPSASCRACKGASAPPWWPPAPASCSTTA